MFVLYAPYDEIYSNVRVSSLKIKMDVSRFCGIAVQIWSCAYIYRYNFIFGHNSWIPVFEILLFCEIENERKTAARRTKGETLCDLNYSKMKILEKQVSDKGWHSIFYGKVHQHVSLTLSTLLGSSCRIGWTNQRHEVFSYRLPITNIVRLP